MDDQTVEWLLESKNPSVRYFTRKDLLDEREGSKGVQAEESKISGGPLVKSLLAGQLSDGGFSVHPYAKWTGAHWRLVSLVEMGIPAGHPKAVKMAGQVLECCRARSIEAGLRK